MATNTTTEKPVRVGIFSTVAAAEQAVDKLLQAGFTKDQVTVICSDQTKEAHFRQFEHQEPAGTYSIPATVTGGAIGAALGGLSALVGVVATGGIGLAAAGGVGAWAGGVFGGLVGAMMTRGVTKEIANYYDQAVAGGKILVAAEDHSSHQSEMLGKATRILSEAGAEPLPMREG